MKMNSTTLLFNLTDIYDIPIQRTIMPKTFQIISLKSEFDYLTPKWITSTTTVLHVLDN